MDIDRRDTALVFTDPQNEVLSETGLAWPLVRESLAENNTIENVDRLFAAAKRDGFEVFISPHYFYPTDADELGDLDTADLFSEVSRGIDKWLWFVEAHLQAER